MICNKCGLDKTEYYGRNRVCKKCYNTRRAINQRIQYQTDKTYREKVLLRAREKRQK